MFYLLFYNLLFLFVSMNKLMKENYIITIRQIAEIYSETIWELKQGKTCKKYR